MPSSSLPPPSPSSFSDDPHHLTDLSCAEEIILLLCIVFLSLSQSLNSANSSLLTQKKLPTFVVLKKFLVVKSLESILEKTPVSLRCVHNTDMEKHTKESRDKTSHNLPVCLILYIGTSHSARYFPLILQHNYKFCYI